MVSRERDGDPDGPSESCPTDRGLKTAECRTVAWSARAVALSDAFRSD